jgi:hypothetical protein
MFVSTVSLSSFGFSQVILSLGLPSVFHWLSNIVLEIMGGPLGVFLCQLASMVIDLHLGVELRCVSAWASQALFVQPSSWSAGFPSAWLALQSPFLYKKLSCASVIFGFLQPSAGVALEFHIS